MNGRYGELDYPQMVKGGVALGIGLIVLGVLGETVGRAAYGALPGWEHALFTSLEFGGVAVVLVAVFVFGIALPLTE